ncbi:DUF3373 domain-containing protein [Sulfurimonas autotrophica]|uniref:DUF3373 domain-containing protein n=1 Tax=Sulfurimonas autotrophica (strain ATCC BAA-671 / DSM 16294 / JCM 11897 / OK10) TaxID=563040 RepID=E0UUT5_SULAO|nr:DUF3373 domain-containing protein [Sulfurimonas autotrophica]ADN08447.1 conserved hypothetical protein [Sulfurimonas autotrophica DSM 16294]
MKKPLLLSLATIAILGTTNVSAESMYDRFQAMELEMKKMKKELDELKAKQNAVAAADEEEDEDEVSSDNKETASADDEEDEGEDEEMTVEEQLADIQDTLSDLNKNTNGNHIKFNVDYRFAVENLQYKMADGSKQENDAFMTNRLWLNMNWAATKNLSFTGQLAYNKAFGARSGASDPTNSSFETFDWIANENAYDDTLRVRSAYFLYKNDTFMGTDVPWTFSIGRRPSTNGHLVNLRDDDHAASPMGHNINVEFDGLSSKFALENVTGVDGMYVKFCAGRGMSNAAPRFNSAPYADTTSNSAIDLVGLIFTPWSDGQYTINSQYYYAGNLIDVKNSNDQSQGFKTVGNLHAITANFVANGIGDGINDFLDDTVFFISGAMSITDPDNGQSMLGSTEAQNGYSEWVGVQYPSLISEEGRWGLEYNHGSKYWRSITYGEDTNIGSKLAARGDAYEAYFTEPLIDDILSLQIRYTYIDYKYAGSNGFFGSTSGNAMSINEAIAAGNGSKVVDKAQDIRFYLRYRY